MSDSKKKKAAKQFEEKDTDVLDIDLEVEPKDIKRLRSELKKYKCLYSELLSENEELKSRLTLVEKQYYTVQNSEFWKITKPFRWLLDGFKRLMQKTRATNAIYKGVVCLKENGVRYTIRRVRAKMLLRGVTRRPLYNKEELEAQKRVTFSKKIKFSILVPLYNTPEKYLKEMIQSVLDQTYANWELCLADGSDEEHKNVGLLVGKLANNDSRIVYRKLEENYGISGNTNACIDMATGDFIALFDHDDILHPAALFEMMKAICEKNADFIYTDENTFSQTISDAYCPHFKPDYAPDTLRANNYICHFTAFSRKLLEKAGKFRPECDGSQDFDMVLRLTEQARKIVHIPKILYYWRAHRNSVASDVSAKPYVIEAAHRAVSDHLQRVGLKGRVEDSCVPSMYRIRYEIESQDRVSILIPNKDHINDLKKCLDSILRLTTYRDYEIIVIENNSEEETFQYYETLEEDSRIRVVVWKSENKEFNYSALNNFGASFATGKYLVLLNNDTEIITPDWLQEMVMFAQRSDVGAVGVKLYYPDDTVQHAGIGIGILTIAGHYHRGFPKNHPGYMGRLIYAQDVSAVTAACVMIRRDVWDEIEGLDESFKVAFNDVDMCMRIRKKGYLIVFTPFAELYHYESKSRGIEDSKEKIARFEGEIARFIKRWRKELIAGDPYYNPNFSLDKEDFSIR